MKKEKKQNTTEPMQFATQQTEEVEYHEIIYVITFFWRILVGDGDNKQSE